MPWPLPIGVRASGESDDEDWSPCPDPKPDFICVGAQKAGTSWLYHQLTLHPDFWMPPVKELHYFDLLSKVKWQNAARCKDGRDRWFLEQIAQVSTSRYMDLERYAELFRPKAALLSGDITPSYSMLNEEIIGPIVNHFPDMKVIFMARDPVERAWSQLSMGVRTKNINLRDPTDPDEVARWLLSPNLLLRSYPSKIAARWKRYVPAHLFRIYFFDDLKTDPAGLRRSILSFLGAEPDKPSGDLGPDDNSHAGFEKLTLTEQMRARMAQFFKDELHACADELNGPAKNWLARYGFSLFWLAIDLLDDVDLFVWCAWVA